MFVCLLEKNLSLLSFRERERRRKKGERQKEVLGWAKIKGGWRERGKQAFGMFFRNFRLAFFDLFVVYLF